MFTSYNEDIRRVEVGLNTNSPLFCSNKVITSKYSALNWAPKSLLMQFKRINNIYFLIISILSFLSFSPKSPYSLAATFAAVLIFTMFKEGFEDLGRHKQDKEVNKSPVKKYIKAENSFKEIESEKISVGDLIKVVENEGFPADLIMIANSHAKGIAFVNTMNLDGETNLKEKVLQINSAPIKNDTDLESYSAEFLMDKPNNSLVKWNCNIKLKDSLEPLDMKQLLLRGCILKNTDWVIGVAVYTGADSKIVLNSKKAPSKVSKIQKTMNWILSTVFLVQIFLCIIYAGFGEQWLSNNSFVDYIDLPSNNSENFVLKILTYWVGYSNLIPISLYVVLEMVRLILAYFIKCDKNMYYEPNDRTALCRASDLIEELGQIQFIFSDKTGTLTCNEMEFRKCGINGKVYGKSGENIGKDSEISKALRDLSHKEHENIEKFVMALVLCNSVFPVKQVNNEIKYQGSSPDELALVEAAKTLGIVLKERSEGKVYVEVHGKMQDWEILTEIPFNSDRKRMSVIVKSPVTQKINLFTKGADSVMINLIRGISTYDVQLELNAFAVEGLRTLVLAHREVGEDEFQDWLSDWKKIMIGKSPDKETQIDNQGALIEKNLQIIGTTAIEDKLQYGVPDTIKVLMKADIRIWVLTGDKEETAIEIAKSCNLLTQNMEVLEFFCVSASEIREKLEFVLGKYKISQENDFKKLQRLKETLPNKIGVVVNGISLSFILADEELSLNFFKIGFISESCVCCRVSPSQKMLVVHLSHKYGDWITLAIGDGANDVSMIQEAHIGIGIAGKEGTQAVQAADFTFSQFRFLQQLLLIHGRYAYLRISNFILYYFYKNFLSVFTEVWFAIFNGFSGQIYFLDWLPSLYNSFWTSWPCLAFFTLEQDVPQEYSLIFPNLYSAGQVSAYFNVKTFWGWVLFSLISASWLFWLPVLSFERGMGSEGHEPWLWWVSTTSFVMLIHTVNLKLLMRPSSLETPNPGKYNPNLSFIRPKTGVVPKYKEDLREKKDRYVKLPYCVDVDGLECSYPRIKEKSLVTITEEDLANKIQVKRAKTPKALEILQNSVTFEKQSNRKFLPISPVADSRFETFDRFPRIYTKSSHLANFDFSKVTYRKEYNLSISPGPYDYDDRVSKSSKVLHGFDMKKITGRVENEEFGVDTVDKIKMMKAYNKILPKTVIPTPNFQKTTDRNSKTFIKRS